MCLYVTHNYFCYVYICFVNIKYSVIVFGMCDYWKSRVCFLLFCSVLFCFFFTKDMLKLRRVWFFFPLNLCSTMHAVMRYAWGHLYYIFISIKIFKLNWKSLSVYLWRDINCPTKVFTKTNTELSLSTVISTTWSCKDSVCILYTNQ